MGIIWSLIIGGVTGWLAGQFMKGSGYGVLINILLGLVGGFVGNLVFGFGLGHHHHHRPDHLRYCGCGAGDLAGQGRFGSNPKASNTYELD